MRTSTRSPTRTSTRATFTVKEIRGRCPYHRVGDRITVEDGRIVLEETDAICIHALPTLLHFYMGLRGCLGPADLGLAHPPEATDTSGGHVEKGYVQCPDPGPPLTPGGTVIFEIQFEEMAKEKTRSEK